MTRQQIERAITQEAMTRFAELPADRFGGLRGGVRNHHTDPEIARKMGLPGTVAQSLHYCGFISQLMLEQFGERWLAGGELDMVFLQPVHAGDRLTIELEPRDDLPGRLDVRCNNQKAVLVATGAAGVDADA